MGDNSSDDCQLVQETTPRSITCTSIPEAFLNNVVAKKHFSQFGRIRNFTLRPAKYSCTIEYETADDAENAFLDGGTYNGIQFDISYTKEIPQPKYADDFIDPDVQDELSAMNPAIRKATFPSSFVAAPINRGTDFKPTKLGRASGVDHTNPQTVFPSQSIAPTTTAALSAVDKNVKNELEAILRKPAFTSEEKFLVLDARDKLIRLTTAKNVDIKKAVSSKGVCPDMCPEKERLMREAKHQVAVFELEPGTKSIINQQIAVKQYSRSSADQETPLVHELRPEPVLKLTMTYLLQNIVDLCDVPDTNISDWYHFLWDRTRSLRKDITQQELCSPESVVLVEQCARFHIHCAARLIAEEPQVFDQRINTENLTKCLQSLKYMYHDLGVKHIHCQNEAEFRAYVVLLNLHDSNFLWEVKQLRSEILHSPEIRFAINVYLAMESNNYVKFFSLVRSTTYMNSCILLRYFTQVRVRALNVMLKSYVPRSPISMSISYLTYNLAFEDFEQCAFFLEYYGMHCDRESDRVIFDRNSFYYPDMPFIMERAINVVEHKRHSSVGDAVFGGTLETKNILEKYVPHDSFDENGYLLPKAWTAEDQNYFKPQPRRQKTVKSAQTLSREDDNLFKVPAALPPSPRQSSPKLGIKSKQKADSPPRFSPFVPVAKASITATITTDSKPDNIFSAGQKTSTEGNIFGGTNRFTATSKDSFTATGIFSKNLNNAPDTPDAGKNNLFKIPENKIGNLFSSAFCQPQKPLTTDNLFSKPSATTNIFTKPPAPTPLASGIFGNFIKKDKINEDTTPGFSKQPSMFQQSAVTSVANTNLFGNFATAPMQFGSTVKDTAPAIFKQQPSEFQLQQELKNRHTEEEKRKKQEEELSKKRAEEQRLQEEKKQLEKLRIEAQKKRTEEAALKIFDEVIFDFITKDYLVETGKAEIERYKLMEKMVQETYESILLEFIEYEIKNTLPIIQSELDKNLLAKCFFIWHKVTQERIEQQRKIENTPVWLPKKPLPEVVQDFKHPVQQATLMLSRRYLSGRPAKIIMPPVREDALDMWNLVTYRLIQLISNQQPDAPQKSSIYWKCLISVPDAEEDVSYQSFNHWLDNVLIRQLSRFPRRNDVFFVEQNAVHEMNGRIANICLRKFSGVKMLTESKKIAEGSDLQGANAVLFFLSPHNLQLARRRLENIIKTSKLQDSAGIVVYNLGSTDPFEVRCELNLEELVGPENANTCFFSSIPSGGLGSVIEQSLRYVASQSHYDFQLEMQQTTSFLKLCLGDEFWQRIFTSICQNPTLLVAVKKFEFVVDCYNAAIDRLIKICSHAMEPHAEFPTELKQFVPKRQLDIPLDLEYFPSDWKSNEAERRTQLRTFLNSLRIKEMIDVSVIKDVQTLELAILRFVYKHMPCEQEVNRIGYKIVQHILIYLDATAHKNDPIAFKEKLSNYSWIDSVPIFTIGLLSFQYERYVNENRLPSEVVYDKEELKEYTKTQWWLALNEELLKNMTKKVVDTFEMNEEEIEEPDIKRQRFDLTLLDDAHKMELEAVLAKGRASLEKADKKILEMQRVQRTAEEISGDFALSLYQHERNIKHVTTQWK